MTGTELQIIPPLNAEIAGSTAERLPEVRTTATTDLDLLAVWLKSHADGSHHTHWLRHAHASHAIDEGAPITLVSQTLGHADLKTTSVYAHARPNDSSSRYLKRG